MDIKVKYGLLAGLAMSSWLFIKYVTGLNQMSWGNYSDYFVLLVFALFIFMAIKQQRTNNNGFLTVPEGFKTGLGVSLVSAIIMAFTVYIYFKWINPGMVDSYIPTLKETMAKEDKLPEEIAKAVENFRNYYKPQRQAMQNLMGILAIGTLFSMITALILKRKPENT